MKDSYEYIKQLQKVDQFKTVMRKLTIDDELNYIEKTFILGCALILFKQYNRDKRYVCYFKLAYFIILKYTFSYNDYEPLFNISVNSGLYPISRKIIELDLIRSFKIEDMLINKQIDKYKHINYIETYEQQKIRKEILNNEFGELCYVAPTSFGKSSLIADFLIANVNKYAKIAIIFPTKSLLAQTFKMIKSMNFNIKLITHDEMYQKEASFIAVLTQERALRMIEKSNVKYDLMFIDEAHNIFDKKSRAILLTRLIKLNRYKNDETKTIYLSPLIRAC